MKRGILATLLILVALAALLAGCVAAQPTAQKLDACSSIGYPPFEYMEGDKAAGFDVDLWNEIGKRLNQPATMQNIPWDGLIPALQSKKCNAIISDMGITEERKKQIAFSDPYYWTTFGMIAGKDSGIATLEGLKGKVLGVQTGTIAEKWTRDNADKLQPKEIVPYDEATEMVQDLQAGRTDVVVNDVPFLSQQLKDKPDLKILDVRVGDRAPSGIAFRQEDTKLRDDVNGALKAIIQDGTWKALYVKWFGTEPTKDDMP
jgi:ABC-type amino acid transport substrate-binding protein